MPRPASIPDHITGHLKSARRFRVGLSTVLARTLNESEWKKLAALHGLEAEITNHHRFLRSLQWNDPDFEGNVVDLVETLYERSPEILAELFLRDEVQRWLKRYDKELIELWKGDGDPLIAALSHGVEELQDSMGSIDLSEYSRRIQDALPSDPRLAIGATKEMLEATMRTIVHRGGAKDVEKLEFPALTNTCMNALGLLPTSPPSSKAEGHIRKIANTAQKMIETANELRNLAGTGHGKVAGEEPEVSLTDAQLVAAEGFILCAWLLRHAANKGL